MNETFEFSSVFPSPAHEVFDWHKKECAFQRLSPPWDEVQILERSKGIEKGARTVIAVKIWPIWKKWIAEHIDYKEGVSFTDRQLSGPFASWEHSHIITPVNSISSKLTDHIEYKLPLGFLGKLFGGQFIQKKLQRMFRYRHTILKTDLEDADAMRQNQIRKIVVIGSTGFVGVNLCAYLNSTGIEVTKISRKKEIKQGFNYWNPEEGDPNPAILENADAIIHLGGESIAEGRWSEAKKNQIRNSRVNSTTSLSNVLANLKSPPKVFLCASGIGIYGNRGNEILNENSTNGVGFLTEVAEAWEKATEIARNAGIRTVNMRFGIILSPSGGALKELLFPFKMYLGEFSGKSAEAYMSWISMDDVLSAIRFCLGNDHIHGPVNFVAPNPVTNREFIKNLELIFQRKSLLPVPTFLLKLFMGQKAEDLLLSSTRVSPSKLLENKYKFLYPDLESALRHLLGMYS